MSNRNFLTALVALTMGALSAHAEVITVRGEDKPVNAEIIKSEDAATVVVTLSKGGERKIPALDVIDIYYESLRPIPLRQEVYKVARESEKEANETGDATKRKAALTKAIAKYDETLKKMDKHQYARRMMEYKIATLTLKLGTEQATAAALTKLRDFKEKYPSSWQINHVMPTLAQLQVDAGNIAEAVKTFQEMADMEQLPADVRTNAELMVVSVNVKAGKIDQANKQLDLLEKKAGANPQLASRVKMERARVLVLSLDPKKKLDAAESKKIMDNAVGLLQQVVKDNNDKTVKAMAHNTLGECLYNAKRYDEALWEFLWVDTVYNQDRHEHAKALYYLWKIFKEHRNDDTRAQECRDALNRTEFAGTEYQRKSLAEPK